MSIFYEIRICEIYYTLSDFFTRFTEIDENYQLLLEASKRLTANDDNPAIPIEDVMKHFEITETDLAETKELEIE